MQVPVHALGMKVAERPKQALERAAEPVDRPRGYHVDLAAEPRRALVYSVGCSGVDEWCSGRHRSRHQRDRCNRRPLSDAAGQPIGSFSGNASVLIIPRSAGFTQVLLAPGPSAR